MNTIQFLDMLLLVISTEVSQVEVLVGISGMEPPLLDMPISPEGLREESSPSMTLLTWTISTMKRSCSEN